MYIKPIDGILNRENSEKANEMVWKCMPYAQFRPTKGIFEARVT